MTQFLCSLRLFFVVCRQMDVNGWLVGCVSAGHLIIYGLSFITFDLFMWQFRRELANEKIIIINKFGLIPAENPSHSI